MYKLVKLLNRERIIFLVAASALALGAFCPWYYLPVEALEIFEAKLVLAQIGRVLALAFTLVTLAVALHRTSSNLLRLFFWIGLLAVLLFPYGIVTWSPTVNYLATSYYKQSSRVTRHIEKNFPNVQAQWKQNILLSPSEAIASVADFSIGDARFFQMFFWDRFLIRGLGYSNNFFAFLNRGWEFTVSGLVLCLLALYLRSGSKGLNALTTDLSSFLPLVGVIFIILAISLVVPSAINFQLDDLFAKGEYTKVLATSKTLSWWYPPLKGDSRFLSRMGQAEFYATESETDDVVYFAKGLEQYTLKNFLNAEDYFQRSLNVEPKLFLVRGYMAAAYINRGVDYFNNKKSAVAENYFEKALQVFPYHVEALYNLLFAKFANSKFEDSSRIAQQLIDSQKYSQLPSLALIAQGYLHMSWTSFWNDNATQAWEQYRRSIDRETWNEQNGSTSEVESEINSLE